METSISPKQENQEHIQWKQMWSLTALYASIVIGWIAYQNYQPKLLLKFSFSHLAYFLVVAQGLILIITPAIAGKIGDRYRVTYGSRLPIVSAGMSFAAMIFMTVAFTLLGNPGESFKWIVPVLIILWLIGMSIFTSPALSTIETFVPIDKLPRAMAVLTVVGNLLYSLEPVIVDIIDYLGAAFTFLTGGIIVFVSGYALKKTSKHLFEKTKNSESISIPAAENNKSSQIGFIILLGLLMGLCTTALFEVFPEVMHTKLSVLFVDGNSKVISVGILIISAILSLPFSTLVNLYGLQRSFWVSSLFAVLSIVGILTIQSPLLVLLLVAIFAISFSALSVSSLPLAIARSNFSQKVFCVGVFFGAVEIPDFVFQLVQNW
jgi:MFS family permease